jgi:bifunctional non-homologous end joining protein LigD
MAKTTGGRTRKRAKRAGSGLDEYRAKRDFTKTPEPQSSQAQRETVNKSAGAEAGAGGKLVFCVQKHDATRLHYDVRLEIAGALMSFAVPKGPSYDPKVKRLAVETEDHPMMYADFEARIPDGQYGAGDMLLWDIGTYETLPPGQQDAMRAKGHLHVRFFGEKLRGGWHFVKTRGRGEGDAAAASRSGAESAKAQWLMFKATDETADPARDIITERPESVKSGKSATRGPRRVGASSAGKSAEALVHAVGETMRASLAPAIDDVTAYSYELKYDGYRLLAAKAGDEVRLVTRGGHEWTARFPIVAQAVRALPVREAVIDGEVCVVDDAGRPSFQALQAWLAGETKDTARLGYVTFDMLWLDGRDLRSAPLEERRELLEGVLATAKPPLGFSRASLAGSRAELAHILEAARAGGLEGIVAKRRGSKYTGGTGGAWRKLKFEKRQDCVIVGWIPMTGAAGDLGALMLGVMDGGALRFAGRVGTGFDGKTRARILTKLAPLAADAPAVTVPREQAKGAAKDVHWVKPELVCEVAFGEWTNDGSMRRSSFVAMREDKTPEECTVEGEEPTPTPTKLPKLSNPDKVLFPRDGITKREILAYYLAVAPYLLPHLADRPLTLQRWPDGIDGEAWYQQNAPEPLPPFVHVATFEKKKRVIADNVETLAWLANLATLTIHQWSARVPHTDKPDYVVIDLDPGDKTTWREVIEVARAVRTLLDALSLESAVKTSGKRGIHIVVPLASGPSHEEATAFGERIAEAVAKVLPKVATALRMKEKRKGLLYVDYLQNGEGKTIVAPYTIRALDGAPVSTPLAWSEVTDGLDPSAFTIRTVLERIAKHGDLFAIARSGKGRIV